MNDLQLQQLIHKAKGRDPDAFTDLVSFYLKDLYRVAVSILRNDEDAADAIQETILTCWEKLDSLNQPEYFKTWLTRILIRHCYDIRRSSLRFTTMESLEEPVTYDPDMLEFREILEFLGEKYSIILTLYYTMGYSAAEIGKLLHLPAATVRTRLARGRKKLNLSEAAISMALNKKPGVSTKTRKTVLEAAEKYGYDFTRISGRSNRSGIITFVVFKKHGAVVSDTPFFSEVTEGIQQKCSENGFKLNIEHIYNEDYPGSQIERIMDSDPSGIILLGTEMSKEDFLPFSRLRIPVVLLDVYLRDVDADCILINNSQGAYLAADYLIAVTKSQPGYLHSSYSISNFEERADGFYKAIRTHGMSPSKSVVHRLTPSIEGAAADMQEIINSGEEIARAYFADNDLIAIGAMRALQQKGYRVPEDVAIIGFDNLPMCNYIDPPLTTINVPKKYMGEMAVTRLLALLNARQFVPVKMEIHTNLVNRHSCGSRK